MECERCGDREATTRETLLGPDGEIVEHKLCETCAASMGLAPPAAGLPITELITQFVSALEDDAKPAKAVQPRERACSGCNQTYSEFKRTGLLGCDRCYTDFAEWLAPLLERTHEGACTHVGKVPRRALERCRADGGDGLERLVGTLEQRAERVKTVRRQLDEAIKAEQYERAAALRDELDRLSAGSDDSTAGSSCD
ncbi:MAG: UvrB/UvrC motif-containing protein [Planctomycetota bacterium]